MNFDLPSLVLNSESRKRRKSKPRTIILRPIDPTPAIELDFLTALNQLVRGIYRATRDYVSPVTKQERNRYHSDDVGGNARSVIEALRQEAARLEAETSAKGSAATSAEGRRHTSRWSATVASQANIDIRYLLRDDDLVDLLSMRSEEFNRLIKSLSSEALDRIERITLGSIFEGKSNADIAKQLQEAEGLSRNRARLIARDQASKLNGAMNQFRHEQAGVTHYKWKTILDGRERPSHNANNNKIFAWNKPPQSTGHPGHEINCRCRGLAVITDDPEDLAELPELPGGDFFDENLPALREVGPTPSQGVFGFEPEQIAERLAQTRQLQANVGAVGRDFTELHAERLVIELYGFKPSDDDLRGLLSGFKNLTASRRTVLIEAVKARLELIEQMLVQARASPTIAKAAPRVDLNRLPDDGIATADTRQTADWFGKVAEIASGSPVEASALEKYTTGMYMQINQAIRQGGASNAWLDPYIASIDAALRGGVVPNGAVLYRGVRAVQGFDDVLDAFKLGETFSEKSFLSTSSSLKEAAFYAGEDGVLLVIEAAGKNGLPVGKLSAFEFENEVLLQRGLKFRVAEHGSYTLPPDPEALFPRAREIKVILLIAI